MGIQRDVDVQMGDQEVDGVVGDVSVVGNVQLDVGVLQDDQDLGETTFQFSRGNSDTSQVHSTSVVSFGDGL